MCQLSAKSPAKSRQCKRTFKNNGWTCLGYLLPKVLNKLAFLPQLCLFAQGSLGKFTHCFVVPLNNANEYRFRDGQALVAASIAITKCRPHKAPYKVFSP